MAATSGNGNIYTVGHSTRSPDDFTALLKQDGIKLLAADTSHLTTSRKERNSPPLAPFRYHSLSKNSQSSVF